MRLEEARMSIRDPNVSFTRHCLAAAAITASEEIQFGDLIECLRRTGLPAELAATRLYVLTGRAREDDTPSSLILDPDDWEDYLRKSKLIDV
jgi:hypothetical protein